MLDKEYLKNLFESEEFYDLNTIIHHKNVMLSECLKSVARNKVNEIDVLTRVITKTKINKDGEKDKRYRVEISLHKPGSIDKLQMLDSCLTTYYFNELEGKEPVIRYATCNSDEAKYLKTVSEEDMMKYYDKLIDQGEALRAQKIKDTWELAKDIDKFEESIIE